MSTETTRQLLYPEPVMDPEAWLDPFDWYRTVRAESPVRYDPTRDCWDVFRYDDVRTVASDHDRFSADPQEHAAGAHESPLGETVISTDPPRHTRLRSVVGDLFTGRAVGDLEPWIRETARRLLDDALAGGECDFVAEFADRLPPLSVAKLLGVPEADRDRFVRWSRVVSEVRSLRTTEEREAELDEELKEMATYFRDALVERRGDPRDDLLSRVANGTDDYTYDVREMLGFCKLMMVGGTVTTTNLLANALRCLADRPDLRRAYVTGERDVEGLVEETLRYRSPIQGVLRFATGNVSLRGHELEPGDGVVFWLGSANRDPRRFDDPETFDPDRDGRAHLAFGHGPHYCLGAPLARLEATIALRALFDRASGLTVDTTDLEPVFDRSSLIHGVRSLPVRVDGRS